MTKKKRIPNSSWKQCIAPGEVSSCEDATWVEAPPPPPPPLSTAWRSISASTPDSLCLRRLIPPVSALLLLCKLVLLLRAKEEERLASMRSELSLPDPSGSPMLPVCATVEAVSLFIVTTLTLSIDSGCELVEGLWNLPESCNDKVSKFEGDAPTRLSSSLSPASSVSRTMSDIDLILGPTDLSLCDSWRDRLAPSYSDPDLLSIPDWVPSLDPNDAPTFMSPELVCCLGELWPSRTDTRAWYMFLGLFAPLTLEPSLLVCKRRPRLASSVDFHMSDTTRPGTDRDSMWLSKIGKGSVERSLRVSKNT